MKRVLVALALVGAASTSAMAESKAEALFKKGKKLLAEGSYADACDAFERSDKLEPGIGTKLNAAKCYEDWGKLARAYRWYKDAEAMASSSKDDRLPKIRELLEAVDSEVPRLIVKVSEGANLKGAGIKLDGEPLDQFGEELRVDPGPHELQYQADGETRTKTIQLERGAEREITLELPRSPDARPTPTPGVKPSADPGKTRRLVGIAMASAGVVGLGVAGYMTLDARGTYNDALDLHCGGMTNACNDEGLQITADARSQANVATIVSIASLAVAAGGVVLYLTAPSKGSTGERAEEAYYLTPMVSPTAGGLVFGGRY